MVIAAERRGGIKDVSEKYRRKERATAAGCKIARFNKTFKR